MADRLGLIGNPRSDGSQLRKPVYLFVRGPRDAAADEEAEEQVVEGPGRNSEGELQSHPDAFGSAGSQTRRGRK